MKQPLVMKYTLTKQQDVYAKVRKHLMKQNKPAINNLLSCEYRTENGLKCAVGCLIKDKFYNKNIEGCALIDDRVSLALEKSGVKLTESILDTLGILQDFHDSFDSSNNPELFSKMPKTLRAFKNWYFQ